MDLPTKPRRGRTKPVAVPMTDRLIGEAAPRPAGPDEKMVVPLLQIRPVSSIASPRPSTVVYFGETTRHRH
jgi:hypothetical protein